VRFAAPLGLCAPGDDRNPARSDPACVFISRPSELDVDRRLRHLVRCRTAPAYAAFDQDQTNESRELLENFSGSRYFDEHNAIATDAESEQRLKSGQLKIAPEIPTNFGNDLLKDKRPEVSVWLDGAVPFRAETASGYVEGLALSFLTDQAARGHIAGLRPLPVNVEARFKYNRAFKSVYQTIPSTIMLVLILIPAIMTAVGVAREKEIGSTANFRSNPIPGIEFLLGK
jgi:ribosome-dependent ATPase